MYHAGFDGWSDDLPVEEQLLFVPNIGVVTHLGDIIRFEEIVPYFEALESRGPLRRADVEVHHNIDCDSQFLAQLTNQEIAVESPEDSSSLVGWLL